MQGTITPCTLHILALHSLHTYDSAVRKGRLFYQQVLKKSKYTSSHN